MKRGAVDTVQIMEEIRARVAERKASGAYSDAEIAEIGAMELRLREGEGFGEEMDRLLSWLHSSWEATGPVDPEGTPVASPLREKAKKTLRALFAPLARLLLGKQNQINARLVQLLSGALPSLRDEHRGLEERVEELALRLEKENGSLREELVRLSSLLANTEKGSAERR